MTMRIVNVVFETPGFHAFKVELDGEMLEPEMRIPVFKVGAAHAG